MRYLQRTCQQLAAMRLLPSHTRAISLVKGISIRDNFPVPITQEIGKLLGIPRPCVLSGNEVLFTCTGSGYSVRHLWEFQLARSVFVLFSGANVANDVAQDNFAEATIGHPEDEVETAALWQRLFDRPNFKVNVLPDVDGVEVWDPMAVTA